MLHAKSDGPGRRAGDRLFLDWPPSARRRPRPTPAMAPAADYMMADRGAEMALARSAAAVGFG